MEPLVEFQRTAGVPLRQAEVDALKIGLPKLRISPAAGQPGHYDLTPGSQVGSLTLGDLEIQILPKLTIERVLFLVAYSTSPNLWRQELARFTSKEGLVEAIVPGFAHRVGTLLRGGLLQGYQSRDEALQGIRGRVRFDDQLRRRFGRFPPAEVTYDDFTFDVAENRVLKAALLRLSQLRLRSRKSQRSLRLLVDAFSGVSDVHYLRGRVPIIEINRLNGRYGPALAIARLILDATSLDLGLSGLRVRGFLIDMNDVFEEFIVVALREALHLDARTFPRGGSGKDFFLASGGMLPLEPDLSWWRGHDCVFVGDVKYKRARTSKGQRPDLYQLLAYIVAADLDRGMLIYAAGEDKPGRHQVRHLGRWLEVHTVDLATEPEAVLGQVQALGDRIRRMAVARPGSVLRRSMASLAPGLSA